jgi:phosphoserine phosphatase
MDSWPPQIHEALSAIPGDLVFDMDGTILEGDLSWGLYRERVVLGTPTAALLSLFGGRPIDDPNVLPIREGCMACSIVLAGMTPAEVTAAVDDCFAEGRVQLHEQVVELVRATHAAGHRAWLVTGGSVWVGRAVAIRVGIAADRVIGVESVMEDGRLTDQIIEPVSAGAGKVVAWTQRNDTRPLLTLGDSRHDLPLMAASELGGVLVHPPGFADQDLLSTARSLRFGVWSLAPTP